MNPPFVGPAYQLANRKASAQDTVNLYLVGLETPSKAPFILESVPGLVSFASVGSEVRGMIAAGSRCFVVAGPTLYELSADGTVTSRGTLQTSAGTVGIAYGLSQLVIVDGDNGYVLRLSSNTFERITSDAWLGSVTVGYVDGFFVFHQPDSQVFYYSSIDDATTLDALEFASAEGSPDNITNLIVDHRELWLMGERTVEVWFNSGGSDFTFTRNNGAAIEVGCIAAHSAKHIDNGVIWIGRDRNGSGIVYRTNGYQPIRVSTQAVEQALQTSSDLSQAVAYVYQWNGLTFWCVNAPDMEATWCYEVSTGAWHKRCDLDEFGQFQAGRVTHHAYAFGRHLVGASDGYVYELSTTAYTNGSDPLVRERVSPNSATPTRERVFYSEFVMDATTGEAAEGVEAYVELSYSNDGGFTWSDPAIKSLGLTGERNPRVKWTRLGSGRDRVWKVRCSANAPFAIVNAEAA